MDALAMYFLLRTVYNWPCITESSVHCLEYFVLVYVVVLVFDVGMMSNYLVQVYVVPCLSYPFIKDRFQAELLVLSIFLK